VTFISIQEIYSVACLAIEQVLCLIHSQQCCA